MKTYYRKKIHTTILFIILVLLTYDASSQRSVTQQSQYWFGYMTSTEISAHYSWWNDTHYVPDGFFIVRTGLTYTIKKINITAGYAHAWLPISNSNTDLHRNENRPWGQVQFTLPIFKTLSFTQRTRYDGRFIQNVSQGEPIEKYTFVNRIRFMGSIRKTFPTVGNKENIPFISLSDEILFNFGENISGMSFNQNRIYVMVGLQKPRIQYQVGYMNRFVMTGTDQYIENHTLVLWITQKFSFRKRAVSEK
ncbi:MAG: DUF2490 domain-containing protein [Cyclobacteriaceae bacterium]|nr:DUF2490 domain-containing protein [Cyclobacteriaceae bacterium]